MIGEKRETQVEFRVKMSKVNLPVSFGVHVLSEVISRVILTRVTSCFVQILEKMTGGHQKRFRTLCHWPRSINDVNFHCFGIFSLHYIRKPRYRVSRAKRPN